MKSAKLGFFAAIKEVEMEIRQLLYFVKVAERLNFTEASKQVFVAQSAISQQIADLENELRAKLFTRNKRSVKLTPAGNAFLKEAIDIINRCDIAAHVAYQASTGIIGTVNIGFLSSAVRLFLPKVIRKFRQEFPKVDLVLTQLSLNKLQSALEREEIDIGFTVCPELIRTAGIQVEKLYTGYNLVLVQADHPIAGKPSVNIASLANEPFIVMSRQESLELYNLAMNLCTKYGFVPRIVSYPVLMESVIFSVEAGLGISIVPSFAMIYGNSNLCFIEIEGEESSYEVAAVWSKNNLNPCVDYFIETIRNENLSNVKQPGP